MVNVLIQLPKSYHCVYISDQSDIKEERVDSNFKLNHTFCHICSNNVYHFCLPFSVSIRGFKMKDTQHFGVFKT